MMEPMHTAPRDRPVLLHMPDGKVFCAVTVFVDDEDGREVLAWEADEERDAPGDWCDGICWAINSWDKPSTQPIGWSPC